MHVLERRDVNSTTKARACCENCLPKIIVRQFSFDVRSEKYYTKRAEPVLKFKLAQGQGHERGVGCGGGENLDVHERIIYVYITR